MLSGSLLLGTFILRIYGISLPVIRVAGGIVVAVAGWNLLTEGSRKDPDQALKAETLDYRTMAFYPLTLPLTTGPGTIAVMISLGFGRSDVATAIDEWRYVAMTLLAAATIAAAIYLCFVYADRIEKILGRPGTDVAVRLSAFILFCIGVQILWTGVSELLSTIPIQVGPAGPKPGGLPPGSLRP